MAINGWYVNKIITDIQEGKVDEFMLKEGKWFNYLKGETTSHTNAADNLGTIAGNLDVNEFSVQGIGALSSDATVSSGSTPALGGNVNVSASGGTGWSTSGFNSYNITALPSTGTLTIIPDAGLSVSASLFTADSSLFPAWIAAVSFADTGTPGTASNTVVATITFNSVGLSSGSTISHNLSLSFTAPSALVAWQANIVVVGEFVVNGVAEDIIGFDHTIYSSYTLLSFSDTQAVYQVNKLIDPTQNPVVLDLNYWSGPNLVTGTPTVGYNVQAGEAAFYSDTVTANSTGANISISYSPVGNFVSDINNEIIINLNSSIGFCVFTTVLGDSSSLPFGLPNGSNLSTNIATIPINSNLGVATLTATGSIASSIVNAPITIPQGSINVQVVVSPNNTGSTITGQLNLTANSNTTGTPNDILHVEQGLSPTVGIGSAVKAFGVFSNDTTVVTNLPGEVGFFTSLDGTGTTNGDDNPIIDASFTELLVLVVLESPQPSNLTDNFYVEYDDPNNTGWITLGSVGGGGAQLINKSVFINANINNAPERTASIRYSHPQDPTIVGILNIKQEAGYNSATNTLQFSNINNTTTDFLYSSTDKVEIDHNAQQVVFHANIPSSDVSSLEDPLNDSGQNISVSTVFPQNYYITPDPLLFTGSAVGVVTSGNPWINNLQTNLSNAGTPITHEITFNISENDNVVLSDPEFPADREFEIKGYNPENISQVFEDDVITVKQLAAPCTRFDQGPGSFAGSDPLSTNVITLPSNFIAGNLDLLVRSNGATAPNVSCFATRFNPVGSVPGFWIKPSVSPLINSINVTSLPSLNGINRYNAAINLSENFTGEEQAFTLGAYQDTITNNATEDPSTHGLKADSITIVMPSATPVINVVLAGALPSSDGFSFQLLTSGNGFKDFTVYHTSSAKSISIPITHNGNTPLVPGQSIQYFTNNVLQTSTPSYINQAPAVVGSNLVYDMDANTGSGINVIKFDLAHGNNLAFKHEFTIVHVN